ncbi:Inner membrane protein ytfF [Comamonas terrigena]|nr:membrane protein [Comamonas terrigena NBRC 13299]SUY87103.1 Inner membrane protein ytfF [Comamonas terrigena]
MNAGMRWGTLCGVAAGALWGLVFVVPLLLPDYPAPLLAFGRYLAFGLIAMPLAWWDRTALAQLHRADWLQALRLAAIGSITFYLLLTSAIQLAGVPLPTLIASGALPVAIAVASNLRAGRAALPWGQLFPSLGLILGGIALVNHHELQALQHSSASQLQDYGLGIGLALVAMLCWTWYPIRNADWLRAHPGVSSRTWATAQGLVTLPMALVGFAISWLWLQQDGLGFTTPLGPRPWEFVCGMFAAGLVGSWLGALCWNAACQHLPTTMSGQLIVCETLSALAYGFALRQQFPPTETVAGIALLVAGVLWALHSRGTQSPQAAPAAPAVRTPQHTATHPPH